MKKIVILNLVLLICVVSFTGCLKRENVLPSLPTHRSTYDESTLQPSYTTSDVTATLETFGTDALVTKPEEIEVDGFKNVIEITEDMFVAQTNNIYYNYFDYENNIIKIKGMFDTIVDEQTGQSNYYVYRYGPGCCGIDGYVGFGLLMEDMPPFEIDEWVDVYGKIEIKEIDGFSYLFLNVSKIQAADSKGAEYVYH